MAFAMWAEQADWTDRLAAVSGLSEPPRARQALDEALGFAHTTDDVVDEVEETNVVELAAFVEAVNRSL